MTSHEIVCGKHKEDFKDIESLTTGRHKEDNFLVITTQSFTNRTLLALNKTENLVDFSFIVDKPFSVEPSIGQIAAGQSLQLQIIFEPDVFFFSFFPYNMHVPNFPFIGLRCF